MEAVVGGGPGAGGEDGPEEFRSRLRHLKVVVRWCERGADVLAWRLRCGAEGVPLSWVDEVAKTRAVLRVLERLGLCKNADVEAVLSVVSFADGLCDVSPAVDLVLPVLKRRLEGMAVPEAPGLRGAKAAPIVMAVAKGLLPVVARLVADEALSREFSVLMLDATRLHAPAALMERSKAVLSTDKVVGRVETLDADLEPEKALSDAVESLAAARASVRSWAAETRRLRIRVKNRKSAKRRTRRS